MPLSPATVAAGITREQYLENGLKHFQYIVALWHVYAVYMVDAFVVLIGRTDTIQDPVCTLLVPQPVRGKQFGNRMFTSFLECH